MPIRSQAVGVVKNRAKSLPSKERRDRSYVECQGLPEISSSLPVQAAHRLARANKIPAVQDEGVANSKANLG